MVRRTVDSIGVYKIHGDLPTASTEQRRRPVAVPRAARARAPAAPRRRAAGGARSRAAVRALPGDELYYVLHEIGLGEGAEILAAATAEQLAVVLDFALWERDQVNPAALGEWLEAIAAAPFERVGAG